jgi:hypothetical protein
VISQIFLGRMEVLTAKASQSPHVISVRPCAVVLLATGVTANPLNDNVTALHPFSHQHINDTLLPANRIN